MTADMYSSDTMRGICLIVGEHDVGKSARMKHFWCTSSIVHALLVCAAQRKIHNMGRYHMTLKMEGTQARGLVDRAERLNFS